MRKLLIGAAVLGSVLPAQADVPSFSLVCKSDDKVAVFTYHPRGLAMAARLLINNQPYTLGNDITVEMTDQTDAQGRKTGKRVISMLKAAEAGDVGAP